MNLQLQKKLIAFFTFAGGIYFFLEYILPEKIGSFEFGAYDDQILKGVQIIGVMSIGLGLINIFTVYGRNVIQRRKGWSNSLALICGFLLMFGILVADLIQNETALSRRQELDTLVQYNLRLKKPELQSDPAFHNKITSQIQALRKSIAAFNLDDPSIPAADKETITAISASVTTLEGLNAAQADVTPALKELEPQLKRLAQLGSEAANDRYEKSTPKIASEFFYQAFFVPLSSAIFSLLAFYIATAAYRAFRIRSFESTVMMAAALLVILGQIPHGPMYVSQHLPAIRLWLLENISTPSFRAIYFGSTVAGLAMAVRMWLSLERGQLDGDK